LIGLLRTGRAGTIPVIHDLTPEPNGYLVPTAYRGAAHEPVSIVQYTAAARERRLYENVMQ